MFNVFIEFPKPIIAAVNGPGIGSGTTAPALCDIILASERASFSTPFSALGVGPEGCASVHFQRILGGETARRLLEEGWKPSAQEARDVGLVSEVVAHHDLLARAQVRKIISVHAIFLSAFHTRLVPDVTIIMNMNIFKEKPFFHYS